MAQKIYKKYLPIVANSTTKNQALQQYITEYVEGHVDVYNTNDDSNRLKTFCEQIYNNCSKKVSVVLNSSNSESFKSFHSNIPNQWFSRVYQYQKDHNGFGISDVD